jgi:PTH1 family peptidyl-tRNA hydrolase
MIIIGLGNPGKKYQNNRHNVGHMFIDYLNKLSDQKNKGFNLKTFKTNCFMNESGKEVEKILKKLPVTSYKLQDVFIVHDDLDIPLGKFRIDFGKGPKLHNGLKSIEEALNTEDFWRIRIGIDNRQKTGWIDGEAYVLQDFLKEEKEVLENEVFKKIKEKLTTIFAKNIKN